MSKNLSKRPDLLIVSDTAVYISPEGGYLAFEPMVREIEHFAPLFGTITWLAYKYPFDSEIRNIRKTKGVDLKYVLMPAVGGGGLYQRMRIILAYISLIFIIPIYLNKAEVIHTRGPSHPALIAILYSLLFFRKKIFWHKYAGNWNRKNDPLSYRINKYLLKWAKMTKVTINGHWPEQPAHILSFENPCITEEERIEGKLALRSKSYDGNLDFVFVGQLIDTKGVHRILEAFNQLRNEKRIGILHLIGDGPERLKYEEYAKEIRVNCIFYGFLPKEAVNKVISVGHVLLLPSDSEGFPKAVAEGANFGCIPVVSDISCLSQYIQHGINGFVMPSLDAKGLKYSLKQLIQLPGNALEQIAEKSHELGKNFTYEYYNNKILRDILSIK